MAYGHLCKGTVYTVPFFIVSYHNTLEQKRSIVELVNVILITYSPEVYQPARFQRFFSYRSVIYPSGKEIL
jgi:hypothetical protein